MGKQKTQREMDEQQEAQDIIKEFASKCRPLGVRLEISYIDRSYHKFFEGYEIYISDIKTGRLIGVIRSATLRRGLEEAYVVLRRLKDLSIQIISNLDQINPGRRAP